MQETTDYVQLAQDEWNEAAPIHWRVTNALLEQVKSPDRRDIHQIQIDELQRIGVRGKRVGHLNCNNGLELITIARRGAKKSVGFDIAEGFITQARALAQSADVDCTFICTDVYQIAPEFDGKFDIVVVTAGALAFMPDLPLISMWHVDSSDRGDD